MLDPLANAIEVPRAMLIAIRWNSDRADHSDEMVEELQELANTLGVITVGCQVIRLDHPNPRFLMGTGNADAIVLACREQNADLIIIDDDLSPSQQRNWEKLSKIQCMDRHGLILEIFAKRAHTREAVLQIELARAEYMLPRLKNAWTHLSRQRGGVGLRGGEGEKQLEVDGRLVRDQILKLKEDLELVRRRRAEQRKHRQSVLIPSAAIVGYTNAGKSSLLNCLTNSDVLVEDKLFATLDPTTRRIDLGDGQLLLLTDTVGFVRKLPHGLVEAFKATLEEATQAHFLVHVVDANSPAALDHIQTTLDVLAEIGAIEGKEILLVFNKIDLIAEPYLLKRMKRAYPEAVFISIHTGEGIPELCDRLVGILSRQLLLANLCIPLDRYDHVALLHRTSRILSETYEADGIYIRAQMPPKISNILAPYIVENSVADAPAPAAAPMA